MCMAANALQWTTNMNDSAAFLSSLVYRCAVRVRTFPSVGTFHLPIFTIFHRFWDGKKMRGDKSNLKWVSKNVLKHVSVCWCLCWTEYEELPNSGTLSLNANKCRFNVSGCKIHFIGSNLCADIRCLVFQLKYIVMLCSIACFRSFSHQFFGCTVSQRAQQHT